MTNYRVVSDDHSNHNLPIGAVVYRLNDSELEEWQVGGDWYTQDNPESSVSIDPRDLEEMSA